MPRRLRPDEVVIDVRVCGSATGMSSPYRKLGAGDPAANGTRRGGGRARRRRRRPSDRRRAAGPCRADHAGVRRWRRDGGMLVQLAAHRGATVIATAGADSAGRVAAMGASTVLDDRRLPRHEPADAVGGRRGDRAVGPGSAWPGYATWCDLTAIARASFWGRANSRDGPGCRPGWFTGAIARPGGECGLRHNVSPHSRSPRGSQ
jgi:hypothetical protein